MPSDSFEAARSPGAPETVKTSRHWLAWTLVVISIVAIGFITLTPQESVNAHNDLRVLKGWNREHLREDLLNLVLFMPLGAATAAAHLQFKRAISLAAGISLLIEFLQWSVVHGRFAELQDLLSNVAGALLGFGIIRAVQKIRAGDRKF